MQATLQLPTPLIRLAARVLWKRKRYLNSCLMHQCSPVPRSKTYATSLPSAWLR